ncbi:GNAT family N-acetyltransferase [Streptacidiphilus fuscans]|uniref:GNAT family N-acetyltransferase n=1 Tax=Streptacidiphilus fuscans TaxID=2789292 RepID=A0A931B0U9_9ACTN|nr:GNAT family N-acetyltransferase [Streptacidiphilus fuscans]MBF9069014.1 GNAT family N-acetyltransferase [Streptacidiphilus fuscans]
MDLSWDLLRPVMRVPYVPTLGPIHPDALGPDLLADVLAVAGTGRFLPHDTDQRWSALKDESVMPHDVEQDPERTVIPTISTWGRGVVTVHHFGADPAPVGELLELARKLAAREDVDRARAIWFQPERPEQEQEPEQLSGVAVTRVQLKTFRPGENEPVDGVEDLRRLPEQVRARFAVFAEHMAADGFAFLWRQFQADALTGPILTIVSGDRVVGAIGPMETMKDPAGHVRLLPQYFGVLPEQRGNGYGRRLWRAAMHWGQSSGAEYQLLLTELGSASDTLCQAEGLDTLGFVHTARA